ncbi:rhodanese domain-containing protein CG4456-like [Eriocheir sinensis]|uniref:rhodanese domain-containing protein CG4456-like n=1 Tax=Eriocheir sinensis TaxID=95602 RepID=UPI0021C594D7|nr:rhodanese domain-containing protein CG4456-like [Eriocheir sinensis]
MTDINYEDLHRQLKEVTLVDVRTREEVREQGQLPGHVPVQELEEALQLPEDTFQKKYGFPRPAPGDASLVITCRSGRRVGVADGILKTKGFNSHKLYRGSFLEWTERGGPVIKPGQPYEPQQ